MEDELLTDEEFSRRARRGCLIEMIALLAIIIVPLVVITYCESRGIIGPGGTCIYLAIVGVGFGWQLRDFGGYDPSTALYD